jgi:hypothetical protein
MTTSTMDTPDVVLIFFALPHELRIMTTLYFALVPQKF